MTIANAGVYEERFWDNFGNYVTSVDALGLNKTDAAHITSTYSATIGYRCYHLLDECINLAWMIRVAEVLGRTDHVEAYCNYGMSLLNSGSARNRGHVDKLVNATGTSGASATSSLNQVSPGFVRYLDTTRAWCWMGYLMYQITRTAYGAQFASQCTSHAQAIMPLITTTQPGKSEPTFAKGFRIASDLPSEGFVAHMGGHAALGSYYIGKLASAGTQFDQILVNYSRELTERVDGSARWPGSDIAHAHDSAGYLTMMMELQEENEAPAGMFAINTAMMGKFGDRLDERMDAGEDPGSTPVAGNLLGFFGCLSQFSTRLSARAGAASSYSVSGSPGGFGYSYTLSTIASIGRSHSVPEIFDAASAPPVPEPDAPTLEIEKVQFTFDADEPDEKKQFRASQLGLKNDNQDIVELEIIVDGDTDDDAFVILENSVPDPLIEVDVAKVKAYGNTSDIKLGIKSTVPPDDPVYNFTPSTPAQITTTTANFSWGAGTLPSTARVDVYINPTANGSSGDTGDSVFASVGGSSYAVNQTIYPNGNYTITYRITPSGAWTDVYTVTQPVTIAL